MKKTIIILSALIALVGCNKENTQPESTPNVFNITITREGDTKAVKAGWEDGDVVYVFFSEVAAPNYLKMSYSSGNWTKTQYNGADAEAFDVPGPGTMTAIYLPYGNTETVSTDGTNFKFENTYTSYYLKAEKAPYTVSGGVVSGSLNMVVPDGFVQFAMPLTNGGTTQFFRETAGAYTLKENHLTPCAFASVAADGTISNVDSYNAGDPITGYIYGGDINFSGLLTPGTATYSFQFVNNMGTVATYDDVTYILSGTKTIAAKAAIKFPLISSNAWKVREPGFVTVGDIKWAKWNVGATTEVGFGDYYAWGAIYPQYKYEVSDYQESAIAADLTDAKDVAYQKLGSVWHMPTKDQLEALSSKISTSTWVTDYNGSGVTGHLITADNGTDVLFLPAAGYWGVMLYNAGYNGYYWSSTYYSTNRAGFLGFRSNGAGVNHGSRYYGFSVRPVHD